MAKTATRMPPQWTTRVKDIDVMSQLFDGVFPELEKAKLSYTCEQTDDHMKTSFEVPGNRLTDVGVTAVDQQITVSFVRHGKPMTEAFDVHSDYDVANAKAHLALGILEVTFKRLSRTQGKKVTVVVTSG